MTVSDLIRSLQQLEKSYPESMNWKVRDWHDHQEIRYIQVGGSDDIFLLPLTPAGSKDGTPKVS